MLRPLALVALATLTPPLPAAPPDDRPERVPVTPLSDAEAARRDALTRYGVGLLRAGNELPVQAVKQLEAAAKADPTTAAPLKELVKLYADLGRDPAAVRAARKVLELDPADADTAHALGKLLYDGKKYAEAVVALKQAADSPRVANDPVRRFGVLRDLARACEAGCDWPGAEAALRAALAVAAGGRDALLKSSAHSSAAALDRQTADVRERLGQALTEEKQFAAAAGEFRDAARLFAAAGDDQAAARLGWNLSGVLAAEGKVDDALAALTPFLALRPSNPAPYERYADLLRRLNRGREVPAALARMTTADPKADVVGWVLAGELLRGGSLQADGQFRDFVKRTTDPRFFRYAVHAYAAAGRADQLLTLVDDLYRAARPAESNGLGPNDPRPTADPAATARAQAVTAAVKGDPPAAAALVRRADATQGARYADATWELLAGLAEQTGQVAVAERALWAAFEANPKPMFFPLYRVLVGQRKWAEALSLCDLADDGGPPDPRRRPRGPDGAHDFYRTVPLAELGQGRRALEVIDAFIPNAANKPGARLQKSRLYGILGRYREAVDVCQAVLSETLSPADLRDARVQLSQAYLGLKEYAKAEAPLREMLDDDPDDVLALNNLGYNLADQGRNLAEAEDLIRRAIALDRDELLKAGYPEPNRGTYLDSLGWVLFRRGKLAEARDVLEQTTTTWDGVADPTVWDHLGDVRFRLGDKATAREAWGKAAELYAGSHQGRQGGRLDEVRRKLAQAE